MYIFFSIRICIFHIFVLYKWNNLALIESVFFNFFFIAHFIYFILVSLEVFAR